MIYFTLLLLVKGVSALVGEVCRADAAGSHEAWALLPSGLLQLGGGQLCAEVAAWPPPATGAGRQRG